MSVILAYAWIKAAVYMACLGLGLEIAYRIYGRFLKDTTRAHLSFLIRALVLAALPSIPLAASLAITCVFCNCLDNRSFASLGLRWSNESLSYLFAGVFISVVCVLAIFGIGCAVGLIQVRESAFWSAPRERFPKFFGCLSDFVLGATYEEIVMRGYVLILLLRASGPDAAVIGSALIFSLFHLIKHPKMPAVFTVNAFVFGVLAAHARLATGALWLPIGLHLGWNLTMGPILGLPCSGRNYENGLLLSSTKGPAWISGGLYSPDAGVLGMAGLLVAIAGLMMIAPLS